MPTIGPTADGNGLRAGFARYDDSKFVMNFGTTVGWLTASPEEAHFIAVLVRKAVEHEFGKLSYDKSTLPIRVEAIPEGRMIKITLPAHTKAVVANPEMWLAFCERLEDEIVVLKRSIQ